MIDLEITAEIKKYIEQHRHKNIDSPILDYNDLLNLPAAAATPPPSFIGITVGDNTGTYTDDLNNIATIAGGTDINISSGALSLRLRKYLAGVSQTVGVATIWGAATAVRQAVITAGGYFYALLSDGANARLYRCATTADVANGANWTQMTISGTAIDITMNLVGYGNGTFWVANTTQFEVYTLSGTTWTSGTAVTVTGSAYAQSIVNGTGIYANFVSGAPGYRFASYDGTLSGKQWSTTTGTAEGVFGYSTSIYRQIFDAGGVVTGYARFDY